MSMGQEATSPAAEEESGQTSATIPDFSAMTEEEQIAYAMQMSMASDEGELQNKCGLSIIYSMVYDICYNSDIIAINLCSSRRSYGDGDRRRCYSYGD